MRDVVACRFESDREICAGNDREFAARNRLDRVKAFLCDSKPVVQVHHCRRLPNWFCTNRGTDDRHRLDAECMANCNQSRDGDAVRALFIFLNLLERNADDAGQFFLAEPGLLTQVSDSAADCDVGCVHALG